MERPDDQSMSIHGVVLDAATLLGVRATVGSAAFERWLTRAETELTDEVQEITMALADHDRSRAASGCRALATIAGEVGAEGLIKASAELGDALAGSSVSLPVLASEIRHARNAASLAAGALRDLRLLVSEPCASSAQLVL